jgi:hypothetical protein
MKTKIFISFAIPFDIEERNRLVSTSLKADSRFTVWGWSRRPSERRDQWEADTREQIRESDVVVALIGAHTRPVSMVQDEVGMAREIGKPVIAVQLDEAPNPPDNLSALVRSDELLDLLESFRQ